jgi:hypothetical protein
MSAAVSAPSPRRLPFRQQPFAFRPPDPARASPAAPSPAAPQPPSEIYYRDRATGLRLCQEVLPRAPQPPPTPERILRVQPAALPAAPPAGPPARPISASLEELDRIFEATASSLRAPPPPLPPLPTTLWPALPQRPLYRPAVASPAPEPLEPSLRFASQQLADDAADIAPSAAAVPAVCAPSPGSRLSGLIHDTRLQIAELRAILAAARSAAPIV